jgi:hypothetical protein
MALIRSNRVGARGHQISSRVLSSGVVSVDGAVYLEHQAAVHADVADRVRDPGWD